MSPPASTTAEVPPPLSEPTNLIDLVSVNDSKIVKVSLYSGRAEITRLYKFQVKTGHNQVNIDGLPNVLDRDSIRVEGRGAATIHDVTLSDMPKTPLPSTSECLDELLLEKELSAKALARAKKGLSSLEQYLSSLDVKHAGVDALAKIMEHCETNGEKLDRKTLELEKKLKKLGDDIKEERDRLAGTPRNQKLGVRASVGVFAASEGEVAIALIYAVWSASWSAGYDIRVDMQTKEKPVTLVYKAAITQDTGESWDDVPLTLETASPTFGLGIPTLTPWNVSVWRPSAAKMKRSVGLASFASPQKKMRQESRTRSAEQLEEDEDDASELGGFGGGGHGAAMEHRSLAVTSKGGISATFEVPGSITVPSDGVPHNVTVTQLNLDASMSWVTVPKVDAKTHLKAKIKNASDYTLLQGIASVYVDGSFISRSDVPLVSPSESFDCPLGLDPSIRVTYHPISKKVSHSGFYTKTSNHVFSQRITIFNTKPTSIDTFKVIDQLPVSESSQINVKLLSPPLVLPETVSSGGGLKVGGGEREIRVPKPVKAGDGVVAQWEGADEEGADMEALGRDGKFNWVCAVPSQGKINLLLSWEVTAPLNTRITGLD